MDGESTNDIPESIVVDAVRDAYAAEEDAVEEAYERMCAPSAFEYAVGFIPIIGDILGSPGCAVEPPGYSPGGRRYAESRGEDAVRRIEASLGFPLDEETRRNVRDDVRDIWFGR